MRRGRRPVSSASSAIRAARFVERTAEKVAPASTNVPTAVASAEIVCQLSTAGDATGARSSPPASLLGHDGGQLDQGIAHDWAGDLDGRVEDAAVEWERRGVALADRRPPLVSTSQS